MEEKKDRFWPITIISLLILGAITFGVTFGIRTWQLNRYEEELFNAVDSSEEDSDTIDISAIKVGYEGQTYTLDEFVELDEIPVIVDILIMDADGELSNKQAYVSCSVDNSDMIQYIDGVYGRLIIPSRYSGKVADGDVG